MKKKLLSRRGETIAEVLVAILLIMLASAAFAAMVSSASKVNAKAAAQDVKLYDALSAAEKKTASADATVSSSVTVEPSVGSNFTIGVTYYSDADGTLYAYGIGG